MRLDSGADGALLWTREGPEPTAALGTRDAAAGDVDGDGHADVMASATLAGTGGTLGTNSGLEGSPIDVIDLSPDAVSPHGVLAPIGRFDAGGCDDVLVGITDIDDNGGVRSPPSLECPLDSGRVTG